MLKLLIVSNFLLFFGCVERFPECKPDSLPGDMDGFLAVCGNRLKELGIALKLEGNEIITENGSFSLKKYRSGFEADLFIEISDIDRAKVISDSYYYNLSPHISNSLLRKKFEEWLLISQKLFGASNIDFMSILDPNIIQLFRTNPSLRTHLDSFINDVNLKYKYLFQKKNKKDINRYSISIITGPYGGGHESVASEVEKALKENAFETEKIDICKDFDDPLSIATNKKFRACLAFNEFTRKKNDPSTAAIIQHLDRLLSFYITPDKRGELRRRIAQNRNGLIISSVHHIKDINSLGYTLELPTIVTITDFDFPLNQWKEFTIMSPNLTWYLVPREDILFFRRMFIGNDSDFYTTHPRTKPIFNLIAQNNGITNPISNINPPIDNIILNGYPTDPIITYPKNEKEIADARKRLGLEASSYRKIVGLSFGGSPNLQKLHQLIEDIIKNKHKLNFKVELVLLSGGHKELISGISKLFKDLNIYVKTDLGDDNRGYEAETIIGKILPFMNREDMSNFYKAADVVLSKAGGATTAELAESSTNYLRVFGLEKWEIENAIYLERLGLSVDTPASKINSLNVDYAPYYNDLTGEELINSLNLLISRKKKTLPIDNYLHYKRASLLDKVNQVLKSFYGVQ